LLEWVKAAPATSGDAFADDVVLSSVSGKLSGALVRGRLVHIDAHSEHSQLSNFWLPWTRHGAQ
jgi:hypothetical protein